MRAGVQHGQRDGAIVALDGADGAGDGGEIGHVEGGRQDPPARLARQLGQGVGVARRGDDHAPVAREAQRQGAANARRCAGDPDETGAGRGRHVQVIRERENDSEGDDSAGR